jgi:hypothetical protein
VTTYRERLRAPLSWWLSAAVFGVIWGWIMLVVTTWPIAFVTTLVVVGAGFVAVWRYGSVLIAVDAEGLHAGRASLDPGHVGAAQPLNRVDYRHRLGVGADARAYLLTRPYLDHGVMVAVDDDSDPAPYWLLSSRHPEALAAALGWTDPGHTEDAPTVQDTTGETSRGEEV